MTPFDLTAQAATRNESDDLLGHFFAEFLDTDEFGDFRRVEALLPAIRRGATTHSGHPLIRPRDCDKITEGLGLIFEKAKPQFRLGDERITERFERIIGEFTQHCAAVYPSEASAALALHGRVLLFMGQHERVLDVVGEWVARPYALESTAHIMDLVDLYAQAHLRLGTLDQSKISFIALGEWVAVNCRTYRARAIGPKLAPYVLFDASVARPPPLRHRLIRFASRGLLAATRTYGTPFGKVMSFLRRQLWGLVLAGCYAWTPKSVSKRSPYALAMNPAGTTLVARAMGGIGDLLMMEPGLEALAASQNRPVDFAIPKKFFPIFKGNPHVRLVDIHGPPIPLAEYRRFVNLSNCPASRYESKARPRIKRSRVEVFAKAMGVGARQLAERGGRINSFPEAGDAAFCDRFLAEKGLGQRRRLVGVQPFSRDSYKDYPSIGAVIAGLAADFDVLVFHHVDTDLATGPGIGSTAGLSLEQSLALLGRLDAMVAVDSAFLHAAAAHDYPVVALFGPTDPRPLTRHHRKPIILWKKDTFPCVPCWRNEDTPCALTEVRWGKLRMDGTLKTKQPSAFVAANSVSPCVAAIAPDEVVAAVVDALGSVGR